MNSRVLHEMINGINVANQPEYLLKCTKYQMNPSSK